MARAHFRASDGQVGANGDPVLLFCANRAKAKTCGKAVGAPSPYLQEFKWGAKAPSVEIRINSSMGYQAIPFRVQQAFSHAGKK